ncbi:hypothetical protein [Aeromonas phage PVN02]|nr:hypothetical protein [Aeromonas phage PVN02]QTQ06877.1 hypothetical protein [Aeromonas phage PVN04]CAC9972301.1 hypothetical protein PVN02_00034 [Aeromonas phage PVN02]
MTMQTPMLQHPDVVAPTVTPFPQEVANFNLLIAMNRTSEKAPHYFGSFKLNGQWYQVSTWIQFAKNTGQQMLNNSIRPCTPEEAAKHEARDAVFRANAPAARTPQMQNTVANPMQQQTAPEIANPVEQIAPTDGDPF